MIVWACIAPHGGEVVPELAGDNLARMAVTRSGMEELGRRCLAAQPDTIVVYTPHGVHQEGAVTVSVTPYAEGELGGEDGSSISARFEVDTELARAISFHADSMGVPVAQGLFQPDGEVAEVFPLDWGALIPLWFMGAKWKNRPKVVVICPSRSLTREQLMDFGRATAEASAMHGKRVALICSADQGHGHDAEGPYGFSAGSADYDAVYCAAVKENNLKSLLKWEEEWIKAAMTDSFWQTLMLHGASLHTRMKPDLLSYEAPTYFGMACAEFAI